MCQALDVVRNTKIADVIATDTGKEQSNRMVGGEGRRSRSGSKDRIIKRESLESVAYDRGSGTGDEVSISGVEWRGDGVSMST